MVLCNRSRLVPSLCSKCLLRNLNGQLKVEVVFHRKGLLKSGWEREVSDMSVFESAARCVSPLSPVWCVRVCETAGYQMSASSSLYHHESSCFFLGSFHEDSSIYTVSLRKSSSKKSGICLFVSLCKVFLL